MKPDILPDDLSRDFITYRSHKEPVLSEFSTPQLLLHAGKGSANRLRTHRVPSINSSPLKNLRFPNTARLAEFFDHTGMSQSPGHYVSPESPR